MSSCAKKKTDTSVINETPNVKIQDATEKSIEQTFELTATVQAQLKNSIAPSAPGRIREILVEVVSHVVKGQKIVGMDDKSQDTGR